MATKHESGDGLILFDRLAAAARTAARLKT